MCHVETDAAFVHHLTLEPISVAYHENHKGAVSVVSAASDRRAWLFIIRLMVEIALQLYLNPLSWNVAVMLVKSFRLLFSFLFLPSNICMAPKMSGSCHRGRTWYDDRILHALNVNDFKTGLTVLIQESRATVVNKRKLNRIQFLRIILADYFYCLHDCGLPHHLAWPLLDMTCFFLRKRNNKITFTGVLLSCSGTLQRPLLSHFLRKKKWDGCIRQPHYRFPSSFSEWPNWPENSYPEPADRVCCQYGPFIRGWLGSAWTVLFCLGPAVSEAAKVNWTSDPNRPAAGNWPPKSVLFSTRQMPQIVWSAVKGLCKCVKTDKLWILSTDWDLEEVVVVVGWGVTLLLVMNFISNYNN